MTTKTVLVTLRAVASGVEHRMEYAVEHPSDAPDCDVPIGKIQALALTQAWDREWADGSPMWTYWVVSRIVDEDNR
jgi:hypothetical protein